jgi:hypothetical protein
MALQTATNLKTKTSRQYHNVIDSNLNLTDGGTVAGASTFSAATTFSAAPLETGVQRLATDAILTIADTTSLVMFAHAGASTSRIITMPAATVGRRFRIVWELTQTGNDRVLTAAGSDDMTGNIFTSVTGNAAGDGDIVGIAAASTAITFLDDISLGSYVDCYCGVAGTWLVVGHLVLDAVGNVPTIA